jgi:hypothetical protein
MDPDVALLKLLTTKDFAEYVEAWLDLIGWLTKGGFPPHNPSHNQTGDRRLWIFRPNPTDTWHLQTIDPNSAEKGWQIIHFVADKAKASFLLEAVK